MDQVGGVARIETDKVNWLAKHGYDVTVCDIEDWPMHPYYPLDERVKFLVGHITTTPGGLWQRAKNVCRAVQKVLSIIEEEKPDVIINAHCPVVTWILPFVARHIPKIAEMHQSRQGLEVFNKWAMSKMMSRLHLFLTRFIYGRYAKFVTLTTADMQSWKLKNSVCIPNFSNIKPTIRQPIEHRQIIMLARLMPQKRIDLMIRVWQKLASQFPNWKVRVFGEGEMRSELQKQIDEANLSESFQLMGATKNVQAEIQNSDILCLTSEYEGFGIVLIEAMNMGVPVVAMEYVGVHDIIENGIDGVVVPFGNVDEYVQKLSELILSEQRRKQIAIRAYQSVAKFDSEAIMQKWTRLFGEIRQLNFRK